MQTEQKRSIRIVHDVPLQLEPGEIYKVLPQNYSQEFYSLRTDREIGNRTRDEIELTAKLPVLHAGAGGMGGLMVLTGHRGGHAVSIVVDPGYFDETNSNRQAASTMGTMGRNKAAETVRMARDIAPDTTFYIVTESLTEELWAGLARNSNLRLSLMYDEIELFEAEARLTLHKIAKALKVPVLNCNTVLYRTYLFMFDYSRPDNKMNLAEFVAASLEKDETYVEDWRVRKRENKTTQKEDADMEAAMIRVLIPEVPEYSRDTDAYSNVRNWDKRLREHTVIVTATNPPGAASFVMTQGMLYLLNKHSKIKRKTAGFPARGYLQVDFGTVRARKVTGRWYRRRSGLERAATGIANMVLNVIR